MLTESTDFLGRSWSYYLQYILWRALCVYVILDLYFWKGSLLLSRPHLESHPHLNSLPVRPTDFFIIMLTFVRYVFSLIHTPVYISDISQWKLCFSWFLLLECKTVVMSCKSFSVSPTVSPGVFQLCYLYTFKQGSFTIRTMDWSAVTNCSTVTTGFNDVVLNCAYFGSKSKRKLNHCLVWVKYAWLSHGSHLKCMSVWCAKEGNHLMTQTKCPTAHRWQGTVGILLKGQHGAGSFKLY